MQALRHPAPQSSSPGLPTAIALIVVYWLAVWASLVLSGQARVPPFWFCNAFMAGLVVLYANHRDVKPLVGLAGAGSVVIFLIFSPDPILGLVRAALNTSEGLMAGCFALRVLGPRRLLRTTSGFVKMELFAVVPAALINLVMREVALRLMGHSDFAESWRLALLPHVLGLAIILPALLLLFQPNPQELRRPWLETAGIMLGLGLVAHVMFNVIKLPMGVMISPLLILSAFRLGPRGAVFGHLVVALVCLPATITGEGSYSLHPAWDLQQRALLYQLLILSSAMGVSFYGFTVADQSRLKRLLTMRAASARDARRRALAASRSKSEFLATMSHEIRTPMNSILGFTQILLRNPGVSPSAREHVKLISEAGGSLMTVLNDILDFSKVEAGQIELHVEPVDLTALAGAAVEIMGEPARAKGLTLRLETEDLDGSFSLDGQRLRQVLLNLLNNAVKFTDQGHILLIVRFDAARQMLRFEVSDTGIGIEGEVIGRLFTRFTQADSSTTRHYGGSGLGLAICKGLVERMGGVIGVDSRVGVGSTFWLELPGERADDAGREAEGGPPAQRLSGRVLLVDDHPMNLRLGETLLSLLGCEVDLAGSGQDAVTAAKACVYDAVLMDVHMPGMDGIATTRAIRALEGPNAQVPIIAMSADVMPESVERCRQAGMVAHLGKPVQLKALHETLRRWMTEQKRRSAA